MGKTMNKVFIVGYAGGDAEQRTTHGGVKYARVSLSTSYGGYKKQDGTDVPERTQWHHCVAWNNLADTMGKYLKKGMKCAVTGRIEYGIYKNAQGVDIPTTEIVVEELTLMSQPQAQGVQPQQQQPQQPKHSISKAVISSSSNTPHPSSSHGRHNSRSNTAVISSRGSRNTAAISRARSSFPRT